MDILNFYYIDLKYIRNLSRADDNVDSYAEAIILVSGSFRYYNQQSQ